MEQLTTTGQKARDARSILSFLPIKTNEFSNTSLFEYFQNTWLLSDILYSSITKTGAIYKAPDPLRHPLIFYLGHVAVFYINILQRSGILQRSVNKEYEDLFERGVDPVCTEELNSNLAWPKEEDVWHYRHQVFEVISELIEKNRVHHITPEDPLWALFMAIEHDRIHFETSSVLIRQYPTSFLTKPKGWDYAPFDNHSSTLLKMVPVSEGVVQMGKHESFSTFGWDNEYGHLKIKTPSFYASNNLISNDEFKKFVLDGGYDEIRFWTNEGWTWKSQYKAQHPKFWIHYGDLLLYRAMFDIIRFPSDWPVEVNFHEALAYCAWKGNKTRLLTEAEFERLAQEVSSSTKDDIFFCSQYNLNLKYGSPCSVGNSISVDHNTEFNDIYGNVWQWIDNEFYPLPNFKSHYLYKEFSVPYFTPKHVMLKGGSWASTGTSASKYYRLWFRKHFIQHVGFRIAQDMS